MHTELDCIVVGAGPAGLTAAHYLRRFHRTIRVLSDGESRARYIPLSHNYPGFPHGVEGGELLRRMEEQFRAVDGDITPAHLVALNATANGFEMVVDQTVLRTRKVLLATGVRDMEPPIDGVEAIRALGLLRQCPICDGFEFTGRKIGVVGSGWHGVREVQFLRTFSPDIVYVPLGDALTQDMHAALASCAIIVDAAPLQRVSAGHAGGVNIHTGDGAVRQVDVLYAALGSSPRSELAAQLGAQLDEYRNIVVDAHCRTSVPNLFAAGDVVAGLDQLAVAIGHGAVAATAIHNELRHEK